LLETSITFATLCHVIANLHPPSRIRPELKSEWLLDPKVTFLNHGSFGAVPRCVFVEQTRWRLRIEAEPVEILARRGPQLLLEARKAVGRWLGMNEDDFGFVTNATEGVNAVLRSLKLDAGDEIVTTTHVYNAVRQAMTFVAQRAGAVYREIDLPLPTRAADEVLEHVVGGLSPRTRLLLIDHVTSPTALVFPVEKIIAACTTKGIDVMVDGAHAPGMLPLNVPQLGAAYYAGNLHKWACAPKGSGFLWVRPDRQDLIHPLVISHHLSEGFAREFSWQGTRDISAWLSIPRALEFMAELGWERVREHNHAMAAWVQRTLWDAWNVEPISPIDGSMVGSMATVVLPPPLAHLTQDQVSVLQQRLYTEHRIEVPLMRWNGRCFARPCCQVYNEPAEYRRLAQVIAQLATEPVQK
jgi:isopenicillin-N epimerase